MDTVRGPIAQLVAGDLVYQVTLASGMVVTSPAGFGKTEYTLTTPVVVISEDGRILSVPRGSDDAVA